MQRTAFTFDIFRISYNCVEDPMFMSIHNATDTSSSPSAMHLLPFIYATTSLILAPVNIIANSFSCHVFRQPAWKRSCTSQLLIGLSLFEVLFHVCVFTDIIVRRHSPMNYGSVSGALTLLVIVKIINYLQITFQLSRNWVVVLLAAYRYEVICRPLSYWKVFREDRIFYALLLTFSTLLVLAFPRLFDTIYTICSNNNTGVVSLQWTDVDELWYNFGYMGGLMFIIQSGGPICLVISLSAFVVRIIWERNQFRRARQAQTSMCNVQSSKSIVSGNPLSSDARAATPAASSRTSPSSDKLVMTLCFTFFILEIPTFFSKILHPILMTNHPLLDNTLLVVANLLVYLDSAVNIFVFMASNPTYRLVAATQLRRLILCHPHSNTPVYNHMQRRISCEETMATSGDVHRGLLLKSTANLPINNKVSTYVKVNNQTVDNGEV